MAPHERRDPRIRPSHRRSNSERDTRSLGACVLFLHIPKTAGKTFRSTLSVNYPRRETIHLDILDRPLDKEMEAIPAEARARARLVWGHMPYGVHAYVPRTCEYVTVLREPVARAVSTYKYILRS